MALGPLTINVNSGLIGKDFSATISGISSGSTVDVVSGPDGGTPGFSVVNGRAYHSGLPYKVNTLVLRETKAGEGTRDSRINILADERDVGPSAFNAVAAQAAAPSSAYRFMSNCRDPAGTTAADVSGHGAGLAAQSSNTTPFSAEGYFSTVASANGGGVLANADILPFNLGMDSFIFSTLLNYTAPGSNQAILGCGDASSARGFYVSIRTASSNMSKARPIFNASGGVNSGLPDSTLPFAESTPRDRTLTLAYDAVTNTAFLFRDGRLSDTYANACTFAADRSTPVVNSLTLGSNAPTVAAQAAKFANIHFLVFNGRGLPLNVAALATRLHEQGRIPLSDGQISL